MNEIDTHVQQFRSVLNKSLKVFFKDAIRVALSNPSQAYFFYKTVRRQQKAARLRKLRQHPEQLQVAEGGCCLWKRRRWVESLTATDKQEVRI